MVTAYHEHVQLFLDGGVDILAALRGVVDSEGLGEQQRGVRPHLVVRSLVT